MRFSISEFLANLSPMDHQTSLLSHFKEKHLWIDVGALIVLWMVSIFFISELWLQFVFKITALIATLDIIAFFSFHLFGKKNSLLLQGLLGGFISSTTVFVQLNNDKKFLAAESSVLTQAMLIANSAMLLECILILVTLSSTFKLPMLLPFVYSLLVMFGALLMLRMKKKMPSIHSTPVLESIHFENDDPIKWTKVIKFSIYIAGLKYILLLSQNINGLPKELGIFLASLLEAHAILAISIIDLGSEVSMTTFWFTMVLIISGSTLSKIAIVLRGSILKKKSLAIAPLLISLVLTIGLLLLNSSV